MRQTILAALVASALTGSADVASAAQRAYTPPAANGACPAGSVLKPAYYDRYDHYVTWRCAFRW